MNSNVILKQVFVPSPDVFYREIEGTVVIIPVSAKVGEVENELFSLNDTGKVIWEKLDGIRPVGTIVRELADEFDAPEGEIEQDVCGLLAELLKQNIIEEKS
jgi:hypothetical protein